MRRIPALLLALVACGDPGAARTALRIESVTPDTLEARGGEVEITGAGFDADAKAFVRDRAVETTVIDATHLRIKVPVLVAGPADVRIDDDTHSVTEENALQIQPISLHFTRAEPWRVPESLHVRDLAVVENTLVAATDEGPALLTWTEGGLVSTVPPASETAPAVPLASMAFTDSGRTLAGCTPDGAFVTSLRAATTWTLPTALAVDEGLACVATGLLDDGRPNPILLGIGRNSAGSTWFARRLGDGGDAPFELEAPTLPAGVTRTLVVDLDADGLPELVLAGTSGVVAWHASPAADGALRFVNDGMLPPHVAAVFAVRAFDADADGDADLLASGDGQDALFVNDGHGRFFDDAFHLLPFERSQGRAIASGDLDLDGREDLVVASEGAPDRLYVGDANGFHDATTLLGLTDISHARAAALFDLDLDGDLDLVTADADGTVSLRFLVPPEPTP